MPAERSLISVAINILIMAHGTTICHGTKACHAWHFHGTSYLDLMRSRPMKNEMAWHGTDGTRLELGLKNVVIEEICARLKAEQTFSVAYSPWVNGSVERLNRDILQVLRAMILDYKVDQRSWVRLIPVVQANLNHAPVQSLANRSPTEIFTGLAPPTPFDFVFHREPVPGCLTTIQDSEAVELALANLRQSIVDMHRAVADVCEKQTLLNKRKERGDNLVNFSTGDFVLRSRVDEKHVSKLLVTWVGPFVVTEVHPRHYRVKHLITGKEADVHGSRLKFFADNDLNVTSELLEHVAAQGIVLDVNQIYEHRWNSTIRDYEVHVNWRGLESIEDSWESFCSIAKDVPTLLKNYVEGSADEKLQRYWSKQQQGNKGAVRGH